MFDIDLFGPDKRSNGKIVEYDFGIGTPASFCAALRVFADQVEAGKILPQRVEQVATRDLDDYVGRSITIRYVEKRDPPVPISDAQK